MYCFLCYKVDDNTQVLTGLFAFFADLRERLTSSGTSSSGFTDSGADGFDVAPPTAPPDGRDFLAVAVSGCFGVAPAGEDFFAVAVLLARMIPFCLSLSSSCFRPAAVVGIGGLSILRGSADLGVVDGAEVDGLLGCDEAEFFDTELVSVKQQRVREGLGLIS